MYYIYVRIKRRKQDIQVTSLSEPKKKMSTNISGNSHTTDGDWRGPLIFCLALDTNQSKLFIEDILPYE